MQGTNKHRALMVSTGHVVEMVAGIEVTNEGCHALPRQRYGERCSDWQENGKRFQANFFELRESTSRNKYTTMNIKQYFRLKVALLYMHWLE